MDLLETGFLPCSSGLIRYFGYTTSSDGTGFGLGIVAEIADAHQWPIDVTESEDGGARFEFTTGGR